MMLTAYRDIASRAQTRCARQTAVRRGFTLIELLVVIGIMVLLVSLSIVAVFKVRETGTDSTTDVTVSKLQNQGLDAEYAAVVAKCHQDLNNGSIPTEVIAYCDNDRDRALAVWTAANLKRNFPESFAEAIAPTPVVPATNTNAAYTLLVSKTFNDIPRTPAPPANPDDQQRAALIYMILSKSTRSGNEFGSAAATPGATGEVTIKTATGANLYGDKSFTVFRDPYGTPITYYRWAKGGLKSTTSPAGELNTPEYANVGAPDPLDP